MGPFGQRLGHLHPETVKVEVVAVAVGGEQLAGEGGGLLPHRDRLHRQHIGAAGTAIRSVVQIAVEVGDAVAVAAPLAGEVKVAEHLIRLAGAGSIGKASRIEHHHGIALAAAGEIAVGQPWGEQPIRQATLHPLGQHRLRLLGQHGLIGLAALVLGLAQLPLAGKEGVAVEVSEHLLQIDLAFIEQSRPPEGRTDRLLLRYGFRAVVAGWRCGRGGGGSHSRRGGFGGLCPGLQPLAAAEARPEAFRRTVEETLAVIPAAGGLGFHQGIHEAQIGEGIASVNHLAPVGGPAIAMHEAGGEGGAAEDHGHVDAHLVEGTKVVLHEGGGLHQQAAHGDAISLMLLLGLNDRLDALLDAEIDHLVAIIGEDDIDEILADVMHVALHRGDQKLTLAVALLIALGILLFLHVGLKKSNRGFHRFGALQHEGQLHLAGAKQIAHHLHAIEQEGVDDLQRWIASESLSQ